MWKFRTMMYFCYNFSSLSLSHWWLRAQNRGIWESRKTLTCAEGKNRDSPSSGLHRFVNPKSHSDEGPLIGNHLSTVFFQSNFRLGYPLPYRSIGCPGPPPHYLDILCNILNIFVSQSYIYFFFFFLFALPFLHSLQSTDFPHAPYLHNQHWTISNL